MVRISIRTSWVVNFALFGCYRPVIYTRPPTIPHFPLHPPRDATVSVLVQTSVWRDSGERWHLWTWTSVMTSVTTSCTAAAGRATASAVAPAQQRPRRDARLFSRSTMARSRTPRQSVSRPPYVVVSLWRQCDRREAAGARCDNTSGWTAATCSPEQTEAHYDVATDIMSDSKSQIPLR